VVRGRPRTDPRYVRRVGELAEEGLKPPAITRTIEEEAKQATPPRDDYPAERTVRRLYEAHRALDPSEQREYGLFHWPQSMVSGSLPWEAGEAALELLRFRIEQHRSSRRKPPTIREARWFWRVRQAAPTLPADEADLLACTYSLVESIEDSETLDGGIWPYLELWLACRQWESKENAQTYLVALKLNGLDPEDPLEMIRENMFP